MREFETLYKLAMSEKMKLYGGTCLLLISSMITMAIPLGIGHIIDRITYEDGASIGKLNEICFSILFVYFLQAGCTALRYFLLESAAERITSRVRQDVFSAMLRQEIAFFDQNKTGELMNRLLKDTEEISYSVTKFLANGLKAFFMSLLGVIMMYAVSPKLSFIALLVVPPFLAITYIIGYQLKALRKQLHAEVTNVMQIAQERIANVRTVRAFCQENREIEKFGDNIANVLAVRDKETWVHSYYHGLIEISNGMLMAAVVYFGGGMIITKEVSPGTLSSFLLYSKLVAGSFENMSTFYTQMMTGKGASSRVRDLMHRVPTIPLEGGTVPEEEIEGNLKLHCVSFSYPTRPDALVLDEVNLDIPAGSILAVVGPSGSGKSTLVSLLLRFYDPTSGLIKLDGKDISNLDPQWLRNQIGTVTQEPVLFSGSIKENILYGTLKPEEISDSLIYQVANNANILEFVLKFPDKFETFVGERGVMLSGGQKQRIAIARALLKNPKILLFDEATSALDAENEHFVQEALERIAMNRTVIIIAHRLSTIKNADKIAVVSDGKFAEVGDYDSLMNLPYGKFRKLVEKQTIKKQS